MVIQKVLYPEGPSVCHGVVLHPPGGVAGGDELAISLNLTQQAHALITTPGAGKWYKTHCHQATQQLKFNLDDHAVLEWMPQENIIFNAAQVAMQMQVDLKGNSVFAGWDIVCLGRQASGEQFDQGKFRQRVSITRDGKLVWSENCLLRGGAPILNSVVGLRGFTIFGTLLIAAKALPDALLDACRQVPSPEEARVGVTQLPEVFAARFLGQSAEAAKHYFEQLWSILRPWYAQREAKKLRLWST